MALSLNNVCYKQIKDSFYYGIFGEFQLVIDQSTGCFNATKLCNIGSKNFFNWKRLENTKQLVRYFENKSRPSEVKGGFYEITGDNKDSVMKQITGQYVQKELILDIASWISPEFYDKCNNIIINYFTNKYLNMSSDEKLKQIENLEDKMKLLLIDNENKNNIIQEKEDKIYEMNKLLNEIKDQNRRMEIKFGIRFDEQEQQNSDLVEKIDEQNIKIDNIQHKLNISVEDRAPQPKQSRKRERFILLKRNDIDYPYYNIRAQNINAHSALNKQRSIYSEVTILLDLPFHPNSKTYYVRIKEELKQKGVEFNMCKLTLTNADISESELVEMMKGINAEKKVVES